LDEGLLVAPNYSPASYRTRLLGCDSKWCGLSQNQGFTSNPARRLGDAHAVSGWKHTRNGGIRTHTALGARLSPRSPVASPNHRAWLPWGDTFLTKPFALVGHLAWPGCSWIQPASRPTTASNQSGDVLCGGQGGGRAAAGGHV